MPDQPPDPDRPVDDLTGPLMLTPERPDEVPPGRAMATLLDDFHHVHWQLLQQRRGLAEVDLPQDQLISLGLAELALGVALINRLQAIRWPTVVDVLTAGGSATDCAAALGVHSPTDLSQELRAWAGVQRERGLMSEDDHSRIAQLAADAAEPEQRQRP